MVASTTVGDVASTQPTSQHLSTGETQEVVVRVSVPSETGIGTIGGLTLTATDIADSAVFNSATASFVVQGDVDPPRVSLTLTPAVLWPPNHKLVQVNADLQVTDDTDPSPSIHLISIVSNEADDGLGDGDTADDIQGAIFGVDVRTFQLRAERSGTGDGRVYTVTYRVTDAAGNATEASAEVRVPLSQGR
jgi:endo-1,4-beta-xylanase